METDPATDPVPDPLTDAAQDGPTAAAGAPATARFRDKRELILDGAARLFNAHGVKGGMIADVAAGVGLATNSLTYYYRRKDDLVAACLQRAIAAMAAQADAAAALPTLAQRVRGFLAGYLGLLAEIELGRHPQLIVFSDLLAVPQPQAAPLLAAYTDLFRRVRRLLDAPDAPVLAPQARNARAHLLFSTASWARVWVRRHEPADYGALAETTADILLRGLASPGHQPRAQPTELPWAELGDEPAGDGGSGPGMRAAWLCAATRLVNDHGYLGASVDRIAAELQLTKGSFYHHHDTKEDLIAACFERTFAVMRAAQDQALARPGCGLDRLAGACATLLAFQMSAHGPLLRVTAWTGLPEALKGPTRVTLERQSERFARLLLAGMQDGSGRVVDQGVAAQVVAGIVNAAAEVERWVSGLDAGNVFARYAGPLFTGLATAPAD